MGSNLTELQRLIEQNVDPNYGAQSPNPSCASYPLRIVLVLSLWLNTPVASTTQQTVRSEHALWANIDMNGCCRNKLGAHWADKSSRGKVDAARPLAQTRLRRTLVVW